MSTSVLVTSATGLIGANVCKLLVERGDHARALVRAESDPSELAALGVETATGDITVEADVQSAADGVDVIVNSAALLGGNQQDMATSIAANHLGSLYCYDVGRDGRRRVIELTTTPFLRYDVTLTERPEMLREDVIPNDPYAVSKGRAYRDGMERIREHGEDIVFVIPGGTFGPSPCVKRAMHATSFNRLIRGAINGKLHEYAASPIPWVRAEDVADATISSITRGDAGVTYIAFGSDAPITTGAFLSMACELAGVEHRVADVVVDPDDDDARQRYGDTVFEMMTRPIPRPQFDNALTRATLGYAPTDIRSALGETVEWLRGERTGAMTEHHDRDELVELMSRYANMPDTNDWDELPRSVLCDEFTTDFSSLGIPITTVTRDDWCRQSKLAFAGWTATHHAITNHRIVIDGDRATIHAHVRVEHWAPAQVAAGGPSCWLVVGFYDDVAVRTYEGWRLGVVKLTVTHQEHAALLAATMAAAPD